MEILKKFFANSWVLVVSGMISILFFSFNCIYELVFCEKNIIAYYFGFSFLFIAVMEIGLLVAYINGQSSYQKTIIGAILSFLVINQLFALSMALTFASNNLLFTIIMTVITIIIFHNHLYLQNDHKGGKEYIIFNFVMLAFAVALRIFEYIISVQRGEAYDVLWMVEHISCLIFIMCIETRIQNYKMIRYEHLQAGTWTQEEKERQKAAFKLKLM